MKRSVRWLCGLISGVVLIYPAPSGAQVAAPANLMGTWLNAHMDGGWPDSLYMVQSILTLRADSTYQQEWEMNGRHSQKGKWRLAADSLFLIQHSDTAINGKTEWPQGPFRVALQDQQLLWGQFDQGFQCRAMAYTRVDASKPLPPVPPAPPVTVKRGDLAGTWIHHRTDTLTLGPGTDTLTLRPDSTWVQAGLAVGPNLKVNQSYSQYWGPNFKIRPTWTVVPGDRLALFWDTRSDTDTTWSHKQQGRMITVRGQQLVVENDDCKNPTIYQRLNP